jgi:hypothetical protein
MPVFISIFISIKILIYNLAG